MTDTPKTTDMLPGDRVIYKRTSPSFIAKLEGVIGTITEPKEAIYGFRHPTVMWDDDSEHAVYLLENVHPAPVKIGDTIRVFAPGWSGVTECLDIVPSLLDGKPCAVFASPDGARRQVNIAQYARAIAKPVETVEAPTEPDQIERLAEFIAHNIPGEPSQSEGAVDCAIRIMTSQREGIDAMARAIRGDGYSSLGAAKDWANKYAPLPPADHPFKVGDRVVNGFVTTYRMVGTIKSVARDATTINWDNGNIHDWTDASCKQFLSLVPTFKRGDLVTWGHGQVRGRITVLHGKSADVINIDPEADETCIFFTFPQSDLRHAE